jgi:hypothetical protein
MVASSSRSATKVRRVGRERSLNVKTANSDFSGPAVESYDSGVAVGAANAGLLPSEDEKDRASDKDAGDHDCDRDAHRTGTLVISDDPAILAAFTALCEGLRSDRDKENLQPYLEILQAAEDQAFAPAQGIDYLRDRPTLRQELVRRSGISGQKCK